MEVQLRGRSECGGRGDGRWRSEGGWRGEGVGRGDSEWRGEGGGRMIVECEVRVEKKHYTYVIFIL